MRAVSLLIIHLVLMPATWARIGDTLEQCKARYGEPVKEGTNPPYWESLIRDHLPFFVFEAEVAGVPMRIRVVLEDGKVIEASYAPLYDEKLTPERAMAVLETYSNRKNWQMGFKPTIGESPLGYLEEFRYLNNRKDRFYAEAGVADDNWGGLMISCVKFLRRHGQWDDAKDAPRDEGEIIMERIPIEYPEDRAAMKERIDKAWANLEAKHGPLGRRP